MTAIKFDRKPYTVRYRSIEDGEMKSIRRVPPPKLHTALPTDVVKLTSKYSDDFREGEDYTVKHISSKQANTLQLESKEGHTTFVPYFDTELKEMVHPRTDEELRKNDQDPRDIPKNNRYLLWP